MIIETRNAVIKSTSLGYEDHGIFTAFLHLDYGGAGQGFGGYSMDKHNGERNAESRRLGTAFGMDFIIEVLRVVGVQTWEELNGKHVRVKQDSGKVHALGHIIEDKWFSPEALSKKHTEAPTPAPAAERKGAENL